MAAFIRTHRLAIAKQFSYECTETNRLLIEKALLTRHFARFVAFCFSWNQLKHIYIS